ncbi:hypothetical protein AX16_000268 [Volvariella volvacea WC 439]|nr:hypothetical protein AX16_000268 [Volvariella volvacea WC 439]
MSSPYSTPLQDPLQPRDLPSSWYPSPRSSRSDSDCSPQQWRNDAGHQSPLRNVRHNNSRRHPPSRSTPYHGSWKAGRHPNEPSPPKLGRDAQVKRNSGFRHSRIRDDSKKYTSVKAPDLYYPSPPDSSEERRYHRTQSRKRPRPDKDENAPQKRIKHQTSDDGGIPIPIMDTFQRITLPVPELPSLNVVPPPVLALPPLHPLPLSERPKEAPRFVRWQEPRLPALDSFTKWLAEVIYATVIFMEAENDHIRMPEELRSDIAPIIKGVLEFLPYQTTVIFLALWYIRRMIPKGFIRQEDFTKGAGIGMHAVARLWTVAMLLAYKWQDDISWRSCDLLSRSPIPKKHRNKLEVYALTALDHQAGISNHDWRSWLEQLRTHPIPNTDELPGYHEEMCITIDGLLRKANTWPHRRSIPSPPSPASLSACGELYVLLQLFPVESEERFRREKLSLPTLDGIRKHLDWDTTIRQIMACKIRVGPPTQPYSHPQPALSPLTSIDAEIPHCMLRESPIYRYPYPFQPIRHLPANMVLPFIPPEADTSSLTGLFPVEPIMHHVNGEKPVWPFY